jgi:hypothetical protein
MKSILILMDIFNYRNSYLIDALAFRWGKNGYKVLKRYSTKNLPDADIAILHIDATIVPEKYDQCLSKYPVVLNRNILNISKTVFSNNIVKSDDVYAGPVIIKTNANCGAKPEASKMKYIWSKLTLHCNWEKVSTLNPKEYPVFDKKEDIPAGVWKNRNLVVEKFLPEKSNGLFFLRYWIFLGNKGWVGRFGSNDPIVKFSNKITKNEILHINTEAEDETVHVPEELKIWRKKLGFDYGRFDYVEHNGKIILFDVNKTIGSERRRDTYSVQLDFLASGISDF